MGRFWRLRTLEHVGNQGSNARGFASKVVTLAGRVYDRSLYGQPVLSMLKPLRLPPSVYRHLHFIGEFEVAIPGGGSFRIVHHGDEIENELFWEGLPGRREHRHLLAGCLSSESQCTCIRFGAKETLFEQYQRNIRLNGFEASAFRTALSNTTGLGCHARVGPGEGSGITGSR